MKKLFPLLLLLVIPFFTKAQSAESVAKVRIQVKDVRTNNGEIFIILYNTPIGFPNETGKARGIFTIAAVESPVSVLDLDGIDYGEYVIMAIHDENRRGIPAIKRTEIPRLPFGFSNLYTLPFFMPKWEKVAFTIDKPEVVMDVKLLY